MGCVGCSKYCTGTDEWTSVMSDYDEGGTREEG